MSEYQIATLPKFYEMFIPILEYLKDGNIVARRDLQNGVRERYYPDLNDDLLNLTTKDGEPIIVNRISWGITYLKQAEMLQQPSRAMVQITDKGQNILKSGKLSLKDLKSDSDFLAHRVQTKDVEDATEESTPQDLIDSGISSIEEQVKLDVLEKMRTLDHYYFENVVLELFEKMGYGKCSGTKKSNDGGIDGIINQDELGLDKIYVQAKHYKDSNKVHETDIRNFIGAMSRDTNKGIFITTSSFDNKAIQKAYDADHKIILIDGIQLADLAYKYGIGVQIKSTYTIKEIDEDYFM